MKARMTLLKATTPSVGADIEWFDYQSRGKLVEGAVCTGARLCACVCLCVEGYYRPVIDRAGAILP